MQHRTFWPVWHNSKMRSDTAYCGTSRVKAIQCTTRTIAHPRCRGRMGTAVYHRLIDKIRKEKASQVKLDDQVV